MLNRILAIRRFGFPPTMDYLGDSENVMRFCKSQLETHIAHGIEYAAFIVYEEYQDRITIIPIQKVHEALHQTEGLDNDS